ncbi:MAG: L,D-transpeptidase family protein [Gemmatimonadaceae bacterium]|nr:L,D-transpeptidase family protein [Gemmatimonadaceae bacterium]
MRSERHIEVAKVFESTEPYSARTVAEADVNALLATTDDYRADSASIVDFYRARQMQFAWILGDSVSANARAFVALAGVDDADRPGTTQATKRLSALYERAIAGGKRAKLCDSCTTELEVRLTAEYYRFVSGPHGGSLSQDLNTLIPVAKRDYRRLLDSLNAGTMDLQGYEPAAPQYQLLKRQVQSYARVAGTPLPVLALPAGSRSLKLGDSSAVIAHIGARLQTLGDLSAAPTGGERYDSITVLGVKRFQVRHGMHPDGAIGADVMRALNVSPAARVRSMIINMERLRWASEAEAPNLLLVNIPEFRLHVIEQGRHVMDMEVVVGNRATSTVIFSDTMTQVVFSPAWQVPPSIVRNEILPGMARNRDYLAKHHMRITGGPSDAPSVRQAPGSTNPLGRVKFLFPNNHNIYMHDTPAKSLFTQESRAMSHGCIRLRHAGELAEYLLRNDAAWPPARMRAAMARGQETMVTLSQPWPVAIVYFTAWVNRDGVLQFRDDVYGHDATLGGELFAVPDR